MKPIYIENIDEGEETKLEKSQNEDTKHRTPYHTFSEPSEYSLTTIASDTEPERGCDEDNNC